MREWLSGRASPCQGERREFESRLPLHFLLFRKYRFTIFWESQQKHHEKCLLYSWQASVQRNPQFRFAHFSTYDSEISQRDISRQNTINYARLAELADAPDLGSGGRP